MTQITMTDELQMKVDNLTPFQRAYCEHRAKGLSQSLSAAKAGSSAEDKYARGRIGYQIEQIDGAKEYIQFIKGKRAETAVIDDIEVINMFKEVYKAAFDAGKYKEANVSAQLIGLAIGLLGKQVTSKSTQPNSITGKNNTEVFKEDEGDEVLNQTDERLEKLKQMMKDLNK